MASLSSRYYWYCQLIGWSALTTVHTISMISLHLRTGFGPFLAEFILPAILVTHLLRNLIRHHHWLDLPVRRSLKKLLPSLLLALFAASLIRSAFHSSIPFANRFFACIAEYSFVMPPWLILYLAIHHVRYTRDIHRKNRQLECLVNEKQSASTNPAIDIQELTGKLDHIRTLIDDDPNSARREITTFSRLLRTGYLKS